MTRIDDVNFGSGDYVKLKKNIYMLRTDYDILCRHIERFSKSLGIKSSNDGNPVKVARETICNEPVEIVFVLVGEYRAHKKIFGKLLFLTFGEFEVDRTISRKLDRLKKDILAIGFVSTENKQPPRPEFRRYSIDLDLLFKRPLYYIVFTPNLEHEVYTNGEFSKMFFKPVEDDENEFA